MKKQLITAVAFTACLALCAAAWPQNEPVEENTAASIPTAVTATKPEVLAAPETVEVIMPEEEKTATTEPEQSEEISPAPEPMPTQTPPPSAVQATPEQNATPPQEPEPAPALSDSASNNMVYVPGFGWIENQGPNHCEYAEDMHENGNKIGIMG